jgi:methyl-accepting chemotaxis protein
VNATNLASRLLVKKDANGNIFTKKHTAILEPETQKTSWYIRNRLIILVIMAGLIPTLSSTYINLKHVETELFKNNKDRLSSLKEEKKRQIENYFDQLKKQAIIFSSNFTIISAMEDLTMGFVNAFEESNGKLKFGYEKKLRDRYHYHVKATSGSDNIDLKKWYPYGKTSQLLQAQYISENKFPIGEKHKLDSANDGSLYSEAHQEYHPYIRQLLETFGYYDIFLVEPETGFIVYSVYKKIDYATSLKTGPYENTAIGKAFKAASKGNNRDAVFMEDFEPYAPSYNASAAFISSSIYSGEKLIGVLIFQVPIEKIENVMTSNHAWKDVGLGESGEVYLVGQDFKLRSNSRFLIENPNEYFKQLQTLKVKSEIIERSKALKTSIGINEIKTPSAIEALKGKSGFSVIQNYRGINVLSAYSPLEIIGLKWGILAEIDEAEALAIRDELRKEAIISFLIAIILLSILGALLKNQTSKNISQSNSEQPILTINSKDEIKQLTTMFNQMVHSLNLFLKHVDDLSVGKFREEASIFSIEEFKDSKSNLQEALINLNREMRKLTIHAIAIANDDLSASILKEKIPGELSEAIYKMTQRMLWFCEQATNLDNNDLKNKLMVDNNDATLGHSMAIIVKSLRETSKGIEEINTMVIKSSSSLTEEARRL